MGAASSFAKATEDRGEKIARPHPSLLPREKVARQPRSF
jgi:hypothetical protein